MKIISNIIFKCSTLCAFTLGAGGISSSLNLSPDKPRNLDVVFNTTIGKGCNIIYHMPEEGQDLSINFISTKYEIFDNFDPVPLHKNYKMSDLEILARKSDGELELINDNCTISNNELVIPNQYLNRHIEINILGAEIADWVTWDTLLKISNDDIDDEENDLVKSLFQVGDYKEVIQDTYPDAYKTFGEAVIIGFNVQDFIYSDNPKTTKKAPFTFWMRKQRIPGKSTHDLPGWYQAPLSDDEDAFYEDEISDFPDIHYIEPEERAYEWEEVKYDKYGMSTETSGVYQEANNIAKQLNVTPRSVSLLEQTHESYEITTPEGVTDRAYSTLFPLSAVELTSYDFEIWKQDLLLTYEELGYLEVYPDQIYLKNRNLDYEQDTDHGDVENYCSNEKAFFDIPENANSSPYPYFNNQYNSIHNATERLCDVKVYYDNGDGKIEWVTAPRIWTRDMNKGWGNTSEGTFVNNVIFSPKTRQIQLDCAMHMYYLKGDYPTIGCFIPYAFCL